MLYSIVWAVLLIPLLISCVIFLVYFCDPNEPAKREWLPDALLASVIANYLLALWVFFYISCHYDPNYDSVYVQKGIGLGLTPKDDEISSISERRMLEKGFIS